MVKNIFKEWWIWVIALMALTLWLSSCEKEKTTLYVCKAGQHDFKPSPIPFPFSAKSMTGWASLNTSCWYNDLDDDTQDWNKMAGLFRVADLSKTTNTFILAWRPDSKIKDMFELCLYENIDGANRPHESAVYKVRAGEGFSFWFLESGGKYTLWVNGNILGEQDNDIKYRTIAKISAWFGGTSKAPHDMSLQMDF